MKDRNETPHESSFEAGLDQKEIYLQNTSKDNTNKIICNNDNNGKEDRKLHIYQLPQVLPKLKDVQRCYYTTHSIKKIKKPENHLLSDHKKSRDTKVNIFSLLK